MASLAEVVATAVDGLADLLATTDGLRPADGWTVCSGPVDPLPSAELVLFGDVTVTHSTADLMGRSGAANLAGWVIVFRPGSGEDATRTARRVAAQAMGRIEGAVRADPSAAGTIRPPGGTQIATSGLQQALSEWNGQAGQQARVPFTITWTSHSG